MVQIMRIQKEVSKTLPKYLADVVDHSYEKYIIIDKNEVNRVTSRVEYDSYEKALSAAKKDTSGPKYIVKEVVSYEIVDKVK